MIQIDMRLPEKCEQCPLCHRAFDGNETRLACFGLGAYCYEDDGRLDNCPLHEVIADEDTISRKQAIEPFMDNSDDWVSYDVRKILESLPPSPSRPKGEWINNHTTCSKCGWQMIDDVIQSPNMVWFNFCPHCGADMREDGEADDNT